MRAAVLAAYVLPAAAAWVVLGLGLGAGAALLGGPALVAIAVYAGYYGCVEAAGRLGLAPPGSRWQVPQSLVRGGSPARRLLVWGSVLGPGFATRNPYAGFGMLPLAVAAAGSLRAAVTLAAAIGVAHGAARAAALLRDVRAGQDTDHLQFVLTSVYWRSVDGFALLIAAAAAVAACGLRFL